MTQGRGIICLAYAWHMPGIWSYARYIQSICQVYARNIDGIRIYNAILSYVWLMPGIHHDYTRHISVMISPTIRMFYFALCAMQWTGPTLVDAQDVGSRTLIGLGSSQDRKGVPLRQELQHVMRAGSMLPYSYILPWYWFILWVVQTSSTLPMDKRVCTGMKYYEL